jgi:hypothetical protein
MFDSGEVQLREERQGRPLEARARELGASCARCATRAAALREQLGTYELGRLAKQSGGGAGGGEGGGGGGEGGGEGGGRRRAEVHALAREWGEGLRRAEEEERGFRSRLGALGVEIEAQHAAQEEAAGRAALALGRAAAVRPAEPSSAASSSSVEHARSQPASQRCGAQRAGASVRVAWVGSASSDDRPLGAGWGMGCRRRRRATSSCWRWTTPGATGGVTARAR